MKLIFVVAVVVLASTSAPASVTAQTETPQAPATETKNRLPPERMEQLVEHPMSVLRTSGLAAARKDFDVLLAAAVQAHGKGSVEGADLLTSFGVELYSLGFDNDNASLTKGSLDYLERAIAAYRAAFGLRHPEVAVALNSYADAAIAVNGSAAEPAAKAALEEAYSIRLAALGPDDPETRNAAGSLAELRDGPRTVRSDALRAVVEAIQATVPSDSVDLEALAGRDLTSDARWKPIAYFNPLIDDFASDTARLKGADQAARQAVAAKYALTVPALDALLTFARDMDRHGYDDGRRPGLRNRARHLPELANRAPIALMFAAGALDLMADGGCSTADIDVLMKGTRDADGDLWAIVSVCADSAALATAIDRDVPARPALSYLAMNWTRDPASELAAADLLLRPEFLSQVDARERDRVHADIAKFKLVKLLDYGLMQEALAFADSLAPGLLRQALTAKAGELRTLIGGFALKNSTFSDDVAADYAAALALAGRAAEARATLDLVAPASKRKAVRACLDAAGENCALGYRGLPLGALVVDQLLDDPQGDPYVLVEAEATGHTLGAGGVTEALCRLLSQPGETEECRLERDSVAANRSPDAHQNKDDALFWAAIRRANGQPFDSARSRYASELAALGAVTANPDDWSRPSVEPAPVPFRELPLSAATLAKQLLPIPDPKTFARLPKGYSLVRAERSGRRVAAISLSQRFDPNGEVTQGGYWLHLSDDGGETWQPPLYTGLADHFPYVVPERSRLPMIAGDSIHLEVQEALIDTATIFYPPVAMKVRRKRGGIYLDIPLADLRRDSDGDGLADIAARHLLLDGQGRRPFVVGHDRDCSSSPNAETLARLELLKKLFQVEARALIEPVDATGLHFGDWRKTQATTNPPIFLRGNAADYRCLAIDRPMFIYADADVERLRKFSPDFQLIDLPPIRWNRDHSRGFVKWSMGWTGGTYQLTRAGQGWKLTSVGEWIT